MDDSWIFTTDGRPHGPPTIASGVCRGHCLYPSLVYINRDLVGELIFRAFSVGENAELGNQFPYMVVVYSVRFLALLCLFYS